MVPVVRVKTVEEAIDHCNANNLALQGCVFSRDIDQGEEPAPECCTAPLHIICDRRHEIFGGETSSAMTGWAIASKEELLPGNIGA